MQNTEPELITTQINRPVTTSEVDNKTVYVCVAVIIRNQQVLIAKRPEHVHQGGLWEFPGGKVEANESVEQALQREIKEELGINILSNRPLISIVHHYPDKSVCLDTYIIEDFNGRLYPENGISMGMEGQAVQWVPLEQLQQFEFPEANQAIIKAIQLPRVYVITPDLKDPEEENFYPYFEKLSQTQSLIQLRIKSLTGNSLEQVVSRCLQLIRHSNAKIMVNSSMALPESIEQDFSGVHLTRKQLFDDRFIEQYKKRFSDRLISASCHNKTEIERANFLQLDFITLSPVQKTPSHPEAAPLGWKRFGELTRLAKMPVYALGGMKSEEIEQAGQYGAQGIAGISVFR